MTMNRILRALLMVTLSMALAVGMWGVMPAEKVAAATCISAGSGSWTTITWTGCVGGPTATDDVVISVGHTIDLDTSPTVASLTVGGTLNVGNDATARTLIVSGDVIVVAGGSIIAGTTVATHIMQIGGDLSNDGTFDGLPGAGRIINVTFNNTATDQTISGTNPAITRFNGITLDKGVSTRRVSASIDITVSGGTNAFTWTNGTWEQTAGRITFTGGNQSITANGGLILSGSGSATYPFSITDGGSGGLLGTLVVNTTGDLTLGVGNNRLQVGNSTTVGTATFTAGAVNIRGRLTLTNGDVTINGATINLDPQASSSLGGTSNVLEAAAAVNVTMSSGSIIIVDPIATSGTGREIRLISGAGTKTFSGGTIFLGDGTSNTVGADGFEISTGGIALYNVTVNNQQGGAGRNAKLIDALTLNGNLTVNAGGILDANGQGMTIAGTLNNNGTLQQTQDVNGSTDVDFFNVGGYGGLTINANDSDLGSTVVSIKGNQACDTDDTAVHRCFDITPANATGRDATITFYYDSAELNSLVCAEMDAWHWSGALPWIQAGTSGTRQCTTDPYSLQVTGVTTFSPFALRSGAAGPTSVGSVALSGSASLLPIGMLLLAGLVVLRKRK